VLVVEATPLRAAGDRRRLRAKFLGTDLDRDLRMRADVVIPRRMGGRAALRRDDQVPIPSRVYASGCVRGAPLFAPVVVRSRTSRPVNGTFGDGPVVLPELGDEVVNATVWSTAPGLG